MLFCLITCLLLTAGGAIYKVIGDKIATAKPAEDEAPTQEMQTKKDQVKEPLLTTQ